MVPMSTDTTATTALETTVDAYLETWNETDAAKRAGLIEQSLGADLWYRDPMLEADGLEAYDGMIAAVQAQMPGPRHAAARAPSTPTATSSASTGRSACPARRRCSPASTSPRPTPTASCTASSASPATRSPPPDAEPSILPSPPPPRGGGRRR